MKKSVNTPKKGVTYQLGHTEKGVMTIMDKGEQKRIMMIADYVAMQKEQGVKISYQSFVNRCFKNSTKVLSSVHGAKKYNVWVCLDGEISPNFSNENGVFTAKVGNQWRELQYIETYQRQNGIKSKQSVLAKARQGIQALSHAALNRYASAQKLNFVVLP